APRFTGSCTTLPPRTGAGIPTVTRLQLQPATASSVPATICSGVSVGPETNRRRSRRFEASALTCDPPTSTARTTGAIALRSGRLRLVLSPAPRPLQQERVESRAAMTRLCNRDRHLDLDFGVAELFDAVAAVHQWPSGSFVVLAAHGALPHDDVYRL